MAEIIKVGKEVLAIQDYQPKDLSDPAKANAFVKLYAEKKKAAEIAELEYEAMKEEAARLMEEYTDNGTPVSVYGMEEQKKAGIILDYRVYEAQAQDPGDADLILTITYKNMAALDGLDDKIEPLQRKVWADRAVAAKASADRGKMRTQLGSELIRELILK